MNSAQTSVLPQRPAQAVWRRVLLSEYLVLILTVAYFGAIATVVPEIATADTLLDILSAMMPLLVVAIGRTFVLIVAGIDLSAPSIIAMASVVGASVMTGDTGYANGTGFEIVAGILAFAAVGAVIGTFNGVCTTRFNMPAFIVTLTTMMFFSGAAIWYTTLHTDASSISNLPPPFIFIGQGRIAGLPVSLAVVLVVAGLAHFVLNRTVYGRWLYAIEAPTPKPRPCRACRSGASSSGPSSFRASAPPFPPSSTPAGWRPALRCSASASCSTSSARP